MKNKETEAFMLIDEHEDIDRMTMIFEKQGLSPEDAAEKAAGIVADSEDSFHDVV